MSTLVIAPHPDDETLGAGGALLRTRNAGEDIHWMIVTEMRKAAGFKPADIERRKAEIPTVANAYGFTSVHELGLPAAGLDAVPLGDIVGVMGDAMKKIAPKTVYVPFPGDVHSDHRAVFEAAQACTKSFRYPSVRRILAMEIISETDYGIDPAQNTFRPNCFVDIAGVLEEKIRIMKLFAGEIAAPPFPRNEHSIRAQAHVRGAQAGLDAAEAFQVLKEIC